MKRLSPALRVALFALSSCTALMAQVSGTAHAPDGRAAQMIAPLYFAPKPAAPFTATARTLWVRTLPDGSTVTTENARLVTRDADGRVFQERVTFVPVPNAVNRKPWVHATDFTDPVERTHYHCDTAPKVCSLFAYEAEVNEAAIPAGLQPDKTTYTTRGDLGTETLAGLEVQHSRETTSLYSNTVGNTQTILRVVEYWYSPSLGVNVQVLRHDPRDGEQTLWLTDVALTAAGPELFQPPAGYRIVDHRNPQAEAPPAER